MPIKNNNVALLVRKKDGYLYSRSTDTNEAFSILQAYPMLHFYRNEGLLHERQVCKYAPLNKQFVWVDEIERTTHVLNPGKNLDLKHIKVADLISKVQRYQIKQLIELGWIKNISWLNDNIDFSIDIASQQYKKDNSYIWYVVKYFIDKMLQNQKSNGWDYKLYKTSKTDAELNLGEDVKNLISDVLAKNPEFLVFPIEFDYNNWEIIYYHEADKSDFMLYEKLLYSDIDINEEDKELWWDYFKRMALVKDVSNQAIYGKLSNSAIEKATLTFKSINEIYEIEKLKFKSINTKLNSSVKREKLL